MKLSKKSRPFIASTCLSRTFNFLLPVFLFSSLVAQAQEKDSVVVYRHRFAGERMDYTLHAKVRNEKLEGACEVKNPAGKTITTGQYRSNRKTGKWKKFIIRNGEPVLCQEWLFNDPSHPVLISSYDSLGNKLPAPGVAFDASGDTFPVRENPRFTQTLMWQVMPGKQGDIFNGQELHNLMNRMWKNCLAAKLPPLDAEGKPMVLKKKETLDSRKPQNLVYTDFYYVISTDGLRHVPGFLGFKCNDGSMVWFSFNRIQNNPLFAVDFPFIQAMKQGSLGTRIYEGNDPEGKAIYHGDNWRTQSMQCVFDLALMESIIW